MTEYFALGLALFSLAFGSILALRYKIPPLIVFLVVGIFVGTSGLLAQNTIIGFLGSLGSILLLFSIGTEFSIYQLISRDFKQALLIALIEVFFAFILLYFVFSHWFIFVVALLLALAFSVTSTAISLKLMQELGLGMKFNLPMIIKISVIEDLIAVFIYTIVSSLSIAKGPTVDTAALLFVFSFILFIVAYYIFYIIFTRIVQRYSIREEDMLILALGMLLLFVSVASVLNLSTAFGAYIAGSIVSVWKSKWKSIDHDLQIFSYLFIAFFFFTVGLDVNIAQINFLLLLLILPVVLVIKFMGLFIGSFTATRSLRTSIFNSFGMMTRGELSLVIVSGAVTAGLLPSNFLGLTAFIVFFTTLISFLLLRKVDGIYLFFRRNLGIS